MAVLTFSLRSKVRSRSFVALARQFRFGFAPSFVGRSPSTQLPRSMPDPHTKKTVMIVLIVAGSLIVTAALILTFYPTPSKCTAGGCIGITQLKPGCSYQPEVYADSSLPTPTGQPALGGFIVSPNSGPPFCGGVWYAYRFVTPDGGYSPLSPWSGSNPLDPSAPPLAITAGSSTLPCAPATATGSSGPTQCTSWGISPSATCQANAPLIVLTSPLPSLPQGTWVNVHRQSSQTFDPTSEGDLIGFMTQGGLSGTPTTVYAFFHDALPFTNPDPNSQESNCCI